MILTQITIRDIILEGVVTDLVMGSGGEATTGQW